MNQENDAGRVGEALVLTVGHSTRSIGEFVAMLSGNGVTLLVDVRTVPRSKRNPQFNKEVLPISLKDAGIGYVHMPELGGLRKPRKDSPNAGWKNLSFRGYADYMQTEEFERGLKRVMELAGSDRLALMCAEAVPWRCHRSLVGDALSIRGVTVEEIVSATKRQAHRMTPFAKVEGLKLTYPEEQPSLF